MQMDRREKKILTFIHFFSICSISIVINYYPVTRRVARQAADGISFPDGMAIYMDAGGI
jgi:hypothetical protein